MVTKDEFIEQLEPLTCSICLDEFDTEHVPIQLPCGHIFGHHCFVMQAESGQQNSNRCPLCREELFEQEPDDESDEPTIDGDESDEVIEDHDLEIEFYYIAHEEPVSSSESEYEPDDDDDVDEDDEREEMRNYKLLPGEAEEHRKTGTKTR
ncbi:hypothetical protein BDW02DRAFT_401551 [Decorospora gaudefroyi]|uniref:RING-type domain-containing protein n=1 Tax=Decorospora gaudefroyi TaxID=184978 RepID=A0A6A5K700_9PLEO|nr:hypothetical protein BDW02DRAFT_401551 [Decorospora gaudefroyi]